ncbi:MAG: PD-(D/E)XK nuclease family protein, partial [Myxococcales bacterium]|nr:PD-(D/E)XK nuclease family protein [Myxococcales bacterium]
GAFSGSAASEILAFPTAEAARRHMDALALEGVAFGLHALSFAELMDLLVEVAQVRVATDVERRAALRATLEASSGVLPSPRSVAALGDAIRACVRAGVGPEALETAEGAFGGSRSRIQRLGRLMRDVEGRLQAAGRVDADRALWIASASYRDGASPPAVLTRAERVVLRGVTALSRAELSLLHHAAAGMLPGTELVLEVPHEAGSPYHRLTERLLARAEGIGAEGAFEVHTAGMEGETGGARLARVLVAGEGEATVKVIRAESPRDEARRVAQEVRAHVEAGAEAGEVRIVVPGGAADRAPFEDALEEAGVPVLRARSQTLAEAPAVRWLLEGVALGAAGFTPRAVGRWVASEYASSWLGPKRKALASALRRVRRPECADVNELRNLELGDGASESNVAMLGMVADALASVAGASTDAEFLERVVAFAARVRVRAASELGGQPAPYLSDVLRGGGDRLFVLEARAIGRDLDALDAFEGLVRDLLDASRDVVSRVDGAAHHVTFLADAAERAKVRTGPATDAGVSVGGLEGVLGGSFPLVVFARMAHGVFPRPTEDNAFLSVRDAWTLMRDARWGHAFDVWGDGTREPFTGLGAATDPLHFLGALVGANAVVVSTATGDGMGGTVPASALFHDVERAATGADARRVGPFGLLARRLAAKALREGVARGVQPAQDPLALGDAARRARVELARLKFMLGDERSDPDDHDGRGLPAPALASEARPLTLSALEGAASCPFKFFAGHVLRVRAPGEAQFDPEAQEAGTVAHAVFGKVIAALEAEKLVPFDVVHRARAAEVALRVVPASLDEAVSAWSVGVGVRDAWARRTGKQLVALVDTLYAEAVGEHAGWAPLAVEWPFGWGDAGPLVLKVASEAVAIQGRVDFLEVRGNAYRITDLKSGRADGLKRKLRADAYGVTELQLPIYEAAVRRAKGSEHVSSRYLSVRDAAVVERDPSAKNFVPLDAAAFEEHVVEVVSRLRAGNFTIDPVKDACKHCEYGSVCRIPRGAPDREGDE